MGKVQGYIPFVGYGTILLVRRFFPFLASSLPPASLPALASSLVRTQLTSDLPRLSQNDYPKLKYALLAGSSSFARTPSILSCFAVDASSPYFAVLGGGILLQRE